MMVNAQDTIAGAEDESGVTSQTPPKHSKRVAVACDYCRKKRLKCTADQQPCTNCQLYRVECKNTRAPKQRARQALSAQKNRNTAVVTQSTSPSSNRERACGVSVVEVEGTLAQEAHLFEMQDELNLDTPLQEPGTGLQMLEESSITQSYEPLAQTNNFMDFTSDMVFTEPFDFWDPEISLHEMISIGGIPDPSSVSLTGQPATSSGEHDFLKDQQSLGDFAIGSSIRPNSSSQQQVPHQRAGKISGLQSLKPHASTDAKHKRILPGLFIRKDGFNNNFIGLNSLGATLACGLREISESNPGVSKATSFNWMIDAGPHVDELDTSMDVEPSMMELPTKSFASASVKAYFYCVHAFYPVIDEHSFCDSWQRLYDQEPEERSIREVLILCLVIAIGCSCESSSGCESIQSNNAANTLFQRTWNLSPLIASKPSVATVQISLLQVVFLITQRKLGMAWVICGQAVRVAQTLGLHRRSPRDFDLTEDQTSLRSRLWWSGFGLDAILSMSQGRPTAIHENCYDTEAIQIIAQRPDNPKQPMILQNFFPWVIQLAHVQNQFCGILCRIESVEARLDALAALDAALMKWRDGIPLEFRPEQEILAQHDVHPIVSFLHLEYYNMLRALHWACITSVPSNASILKAHQNPRIQASDVICLSAARQFVKVLYDLADKASHPHVIAPNLHIEYAIAALAAIYRGIFRNPRRISSKLDLEYFRAGKSYIDREIERTKTKPDYRPLFEAMSTSLQELSDRMTATSRRQEVTTSNIP